MNAKKPATTSNTRDRKMAAEAVRKVLGLDTLATRKRDALDFHSLSADSIRQAIAIAFEAGFNAGFDAGSRTTK